MNTPFFPLISGTDILAEKTPAHPRRPKSHSSCTNPFSGKFQKNLKEWILQSLVEGELFDKTRHRCDCNGTNKQSWPLQHHEPL